MDQKPGSSGLRKLLAAALACRWAEAKQAAAPQMVAAALGLSAPMALGAWSGHLQSGMIASLGGLAAGVQSENGAARERLSSLMQAVVAGSAATFIGASLSGNPLAVALGIPAVAAAAAVFGGISRPLARSATQFIIFLIIAGNTNARGASPAEITALFALGAFWAAALSLALPPWFALFRPRSGRNGQAAAAPPARYSAEQLLRRWRKSLLHLAGWQYPMRITLCLIAAEAIRLIWTHDHSYWISLTVAIVVHRNLQSALVRTLQRAAGTALGVLLISMLLLGIPPLWAMIAMVAVLAAVRPVLINVNYIAYAAATTPLIILLLDVGKTPTADVIAVRLIATWVGCLIGLMLGYAAWPGLVAAPLPGATGSK